MRFLPAGDFIEKTRQMTNSAVGTGFSFARPQYHAVFFSQAQTVNWPQGLSPHLVCSPFPITIDKSLPKSPRLSHAVLPEPDQIQSKSRLRTVRVRANTQCRYRGKQLKSHRSYAPRPHVMEGRQESSS